MLNTTLPLAERYDYLLPKFKIGYAFLRRDDLADLPPGSIELEGGVVVQIQEYTTMPPQEARYETHDRYFDIQYVVSGREWFGVAPRSAMTALTAYDPAGDITFYRDPAMDSRILLTPGDLAVVSPEEAHKPRMAAGDPVAVRKVVVKIPV